MNQKAAQLDNAQIVVIEDDLGVRESLVGLLRSMRFNVVAFASGAEFVTRGQLATVGCMILDVRLPGQSGIEFFEQLRAGGFSRPVIFMSGHADVPIAVRAMKAGAVEFLTKPVREQDLLDAVNSALRSSSSSTLKAEAAASARAAFETLTKREQEVLARVVGGQRNKQISAALGVTEATVKLHRGNVMHKMRARTLPELVRLFDMIETDRPGQS